MQSYDTFARFYDPVQGDRADHAAYVRWLIEKHHPTARTALELACGTGSILEQLQPDFEVTGVDLSGPMLAVAAEKVPEARLVQADLTEVRIGEAFDVVLCLYDSVNHLLEFSQWEALFDRAREHLSDRGIFVFDINTDYQLAELVTQPQQAVWFGDRDLLLIDVVAGEDTVWSTGTSRYS
ncbi:MAG: class I SAM-dependent methyltransferase, partial [Actinobacteria bacterium]|nr:class I SAM-dependent methyltransferase [Actinomycetota bacterium]